MDDLNPKARALVDAGRGALRATIEDRARIEAALRARLGSGALPPEATVARVAGATGRRVAARFAIGAGVVVVVGASLFALRPGADAPVQRTARSAQPAAAPSAPAAIHGTGAGQSDAPESTRAVVTTVEVPPAVALAPTPSALSAPRAIDRLAQEVKLLSRATVELHAGHAERALRALDEHQRKFPSGALREERRTAKAQALCLLGRVAEGRGQLALLPAQSPGAARAEQACDAGSLAMHPQ